MFNLFRKAQPLPPVAQRSVGLKRDADFNPPPESEPGLAERLIGFFRGHAVYLKAPPKVTWIRDPRAVRNEQIATERARRTRSPAPRGDRASDGPAIYAVADGAPSALGMAPDAYSIGAFCDGQIDMDPATKAMISGIRTRQWGPTYREEPTIEIPSEAAAKEVAATAGALVGSKWTVILPRAFRDRRG